MKNIDLITKRIKNEAIAKITGGLIAMAVLSIYCLKAYNEELLGIFGIIIVGILFLLFIIVTIDGFVEYKKPLKKYPGIERMAAIVDAAFRPDFENKYFYIFDNVLVIKARIHDMTYVEDVYAIYRKKTSNKDIQQIVLQTKYRNTEINVVKMNDEDINKLMVLIKSYCPNAVFGKKNKK